MVVGVTEGYEKKLEIQGVGYLAAIQGKHAAASRRLRQRSAQDRFPKGLTVTCPDQTHIVIKGTRQAARRPVRRRSARVRKPEPYKGKGIRYEGEQVRRKAGKTAT